MAPADAAQAEAAASGERLYKTNLAAAAETLRAQRNRTVTSYVIVLSFEPLDFLKRLPDVIRDFRRTDERIQSVTGSPPRQISETEFLVITDQNDYGVVSLVTDLRTVMLKLVRQYAPQAFAAIDQNQLVKVYNLGRHQDQIRKLLQRHARERPKAPRGKEIRGLEYRDVERVMGHLDALPPQQFLEEYVRSQPITLIRSDRTPAVAFHEYFISMANLQEQFLQGINVFLNMPMFKLLTRELDQRILACIERGQIDPGQASFNFNIETLFSRRFEAVADSGRAEKLVVELRAGDIFEDFDKFQLARTEIERRGARLALDNVLPAMLPVLQPDALGCSYVKIQAQDELGRTCDSFAADLRTLSNGTAYPIATRIETLEAVKAGMDMGLTLFQGFYVDRLLNDDTERERFLVG
jgi:EAL domain-containing protein (putative c-di-GMP-specific phosphodiesterase class I)